MAYRNETKIADAITVDTIIDVYSVTMTPHCLLYENQLVVYDYWQMIYVEQGEYTCSIDGDLFCIRKGQALFCAPGGTRYVVSQKDAVIAYVSFRCTSSAMQRLVNQTVTVPDVERPLLSRVLSIGLDSFVDIPKDQPVYGQRILQGTSELSLQTMKNSLELLLLALSEADAPQTSEIIGRNQANYYTNQFEAMRRYMQQHLHENMTQTRLSEFMGISLASVKRIFRQCTGMGAVHYFQVLRMKEAKRLIRESDLSITAIAERLGFSGIHHFSRVFHKTTGMTPTQYARSIVQN